MSGRVLAQMLVKLLKNGSSIKARLLWSVTNLPPFMRVWAMVVLSKGPHRVNGQKVFQWMTPKIQWLLHIVNSQRSMEKIKKFKDLLRRFIQNFSDRLVPVHTHQSRINLDKSRSSKVVWSIMVNYYLKVVTNLQWCFFLFIMNLNLLFAPLISLMRKFTLFYLVYNLKFSHSRFPREEAKIKKWEFQKKILTISTLNFSVSFHIVLNLFT